MNGHETMSQVETNKAVIQRYFEASSLYFRRVMLPTTNSHNTKGISMIYVIL
jgi:hypothetical protein